MRTPFEKDKTSAREEAFLTGGSADNTLPRKNVKTKAELCKTFSFTLTPTSIDYLKRLQLRLMHITPDSPNRSDVVRMALAHLMNANDNELIDLLNESKPQ